MYFLHSPIALARLAPLHLRRTSPSILHRSIVASPAPLDLAAPASLDYRHSCIACRSHIGPSLPIALSSSPWSTVVLSSSKNLTTYTSLLHNRPDKNSVLCANAKLSHYDNHLSLSFRDSQLTIFHPKVDEISLSLITPPPTRLLLPCFPDQ
ncbi:hypothetical protein C4D60_Mb11t03250 [Musa balbisiana]|uniref:Uncharacterized protein n=1 Tax=Musa balbisiana TaxID=52838 RepID=A0A4S8J3V0_MUSBA|nr:hypothetical protein C4D60_Mb11t03250 [Musa balbisiana]